MNKDTRPFLKKRTALILIALFSAVFLPLSLIFAQTMQSSTYKIISDSVNVGGKSSSSSTYIIGDTLGEVGTGDSNSSNYYMHAGFWQMQESYISITHPSDLALASIGGIDGEYSQGTMTWTVITDNAAGYTMSIKSLT